MPVPVGNRPAAVAGGRGVQRHCCLTARWALPNVASAPAHHAKDPAARGQAPSGKHGVGHVARGASVDVAIRTRTSRVTAHDREPYGVDVPRCEANGPDLLCVTEALACRVSQSTAIVLIHARRPRFFSIYKS